MELYEQIEQYCSEKKIKELRTILEDVNSVDIAEAFNELSFREIAIAYRILDKERAAEVFVELDTDNQEKLIRSFTDKEMQDISSEIYIDDAVDIIEEMPATVVAKILKNTDSEMRKQINALLLYPEDSVGSIMTTEYVSLKKEWTVKEAFQKIHKEALDKETVYTCYVTENRSLVGIVTVKDMFIASEDSKIEDIMTEKDNLIYVNTYDDRQLAVDQIQKYGFLAIPVLDKEERLVGIVTVDDAIDVIKEEATEDMEIMAAMTPLEKPYLKTGVFSVWKKRIPWLLLLMVSATFTSTIISSFENALAACVALTAFIPMLMDTGGNAGSQASITIISALSSGEIEPRDVLKIVWKELRVSLLCAATLAPVTFLKVLLIDRETVLVSLSVAFTLFFTVIMAKLIGCTLPLLAKKLKLDPAVMASPLITTIVDALSLIIYFIVASKLLNL